jgi:hypothetical protein
MVVPNGGFARMFPAVLHSEFLLFVEYHKFISALEEAHDKASELSGKLQQFMLENLKTSDFISIDSLPGDIIKDGWNSIQELVQACHGVWV